MALSCSCGSLPPPILLRSSSTRTRGTAAVAGVRTLRRRSPAVIASTLDSNGHSSDFAKRIEQAWLISQQPGPITCPSCNSKGHVDCKWCRGTGFFIIGDNILCEVPSRNTSCVICAGTGSCHCSDCKGTGFRAKWLGEPPLKKST